MNNDVILIWNSFSLKSLSSCQQHRHHHLTPLEHTDGVFGFNKTLELSGKGDHQKHFSRRRCKPPGHYTQVFPRLTPHTTNITRGIKRKRNKGFIPQESFALGIRPLVLEMRMVERKRIREGRRGGGEQVHSTLHLVVHYMGAGYRHSVFQYCWSFFYPIWLLYQALVFDRYYKKIMQQ